MDALDSLSMYFQYTFVWRALIVSILISLGTALIGVTLVLKRFSYIGEGLSHLAFTLMCVAAILHLSNDIYLILPATIICATILLSGGKKVKIKGDASIAMISASSLAIGYLLMNFFSASSNVSGDVCTTLFGSTSILTLTEEQVWLSIFLSIGVTLIYIVFYHKIFVVTFDENFATAIGISVKKYNFFIGTVASVIVVLAMKLVGSLLVTALIIFPALSAMRISKTYRRVIILSAFFAVVCATLGILIAIVSGMPVGSTIVTVNLFVFLITCIIENFAQTYKA